MQRAFWACEHQAPGIVLGPKERKVDKMSGGYYPDKKECVKLIEGNIFDGASLDGYNGSYVLALATFREAVGLCGCGDCLIACLTSGNPSTPHYGEHITSLFDVMPAPYNGAKLGFEHSMNDEYIKGDRLEYIRRLRAELDMGTPRETPVDRYVPLASDLAALQARVEAMRNADREDCSWTKRQLRRVWRLGALVLVSQLLCVAAQLLL